MLTVKKIAKKESVKGAFKAFLSFILSGARAFGAHPFAAAFAAAGGDFEIWRFGGAFLGYLLIVREDGILYAATTAILFACKLVFRGTRAGEKRAFMPACLFFCVLFVKGVTLLSSFSARAFALLLFESFFSFATALLLSYAYEKEDSAARLFSHGLLTAAALSAPGFAENDAGLVFAALAVCLFVLAAGSRYGGATGAGAGAFLGAVLDMSLNGSPKYCLVYAMGGLLTGAFASSKKGVRLAFWTLGCALPAFWAAGRLESVLIITECAAAGGVFLLLLNKKDYALIKPGKGKGYPSAGMEKASVALERLGQEITAGPVQSLFSPENALQSAADAVCRGCAGTEKCWGENYMEAARALSDASYKATLKGGLKREDMPLFFENTCVKKTELYDEMERRLSACFKRREIIAVKRESEELMKKQYDGIAAVLKDVSNMQRGLSFGSEEIGRVIKTYYPHSRWESYYDGNRFVIDVYPPEEGERGDGFAAAGSLSLAVGCRIDPPEAVNTYGGEALRFVRTEKYKAEGAVAIRPKRGEKISGDSVRRLYTRDGRAVVVISDGMGTGDAARELSAAATDMISELVLSGASLKSAVYAVLPVIEARFERSGFVTLDALELDLFCGRAAFIKCGAPPSVIIRSDCKEKVCAESLPAGLREEPAVIYKKLRAGDTVVMATDGAATDVVMRGTPGDICKELTKQDDSDDAAAVVLKLKEA